MRNEAIPGPALMDHLTRCRPAMLEAIEGLVTHESPSLDKPALDGMADKVAARFDALGASVKRVGGHSGGDHLHARLGSEGEAFPALILGHFDTVWPVGTLARMPFRVEEGRASGPGVFDMKSSLVVAEFAIRAIRELGLAAARPIEVLFTSDEEIGSPTSRGLIEDVARRCAYALVPEPPLPCGGLKTARKGVGRFTLEVSGKAAHAGIEPEKGVSAVIELARQLLRIEGLADPSLGTTLNVGMVQGGTIPNVVPASASAVIDVRAASLSEASRVTTALKGLVPEHPGASLTVKGGFNRPPMERTPQIAALFGRAREVGRTLGLELTEGGTGGGSDGNFTAALGVPTLDGLGVPGGGAHADHEHIQIEGLVPRAALMAALLLAL
ncbi:MAG: M20 family metallopeptidase [Isosphaeraceae bacterium]